MRRLHAWLTRPAYYDDWLDGLTVAVLIFFFLAVVFNYPR